MTTTMPPRVPTLDEARGSRTLPSMSDDSGWTAEKVAEIAGVDRFDVERAARGSETSWRERAERRPSWSGVSP